MSISSSLIILVIYLLSLGSVNDTQADESMGLPFLKGFDEVAGAVRQPFLHALAEPSHLAVTSLMSIVSPNRTRTEQSKRTSSSSASSDLGPSDVAKTTKRVPSTPMEFGSHGVSTIVKDVIKNSLNLVPSGSVALGDTAVNLINVTETTSKIFTSLSGLTPAPEKERVYYNTISPEEESWRQPKFFSTKCTFRMACEFGRLMLKPNTPESVNFVVERSKLIHDLHNRYTRAATYGLLNGDCSKYYCVALEFFGGPGQIAAAVSELTNRVVNPDLYE